MALINWFRQVLGIMYLESRWIKRQPLWIVQGFLSSFGFIIVFFAWGSFRALENLIVAFIIVGAWSQGLNIVAQMIGWNKILYEQDRLIASPVTLSAYFFGIVLANTPFMLVNLIPSIILAILLGVDITSFLMLLLLIPIALILGAFLSLIIILRIKNPTNISAITNPLRTATIIIPPVYYPAEILPPMIREIALLIPSASLVAIGRWILLRETAINVLYPILVILCWSVLLTILLIRKLRWGLE